MRAADLLRLASEDMIKFDRIPLTMFIGGLLLLAGARSATAVDLHAFWDTRCAECHGHAGDFARKHLKVTDGRLRGSHADRDLNRFLGVHESSGENAGGLYAMLLAQAQTQPLFQQKCAGCHGTAADYARANLVLKDGAAVTKDGRKVVDVLARHGKVTPEEARSIADSLVRVLGETGAGKGG